MNQKLYTTLRVLLIAVAVVSAAVVVRDLLAYRAGDRTYEDADRTASLVRPDPPPLPSAEVPDISPMTSRSGLFHSWDKICILSHFSKNAPMASSTDQSHRSQE